MKLEDRQTIGIFLLKSKFNIEEKRKIIELWSLYGDGSIMDIDCSSCVKEKLKQMKQIK